MSAPGYREKLDGTKPSNPFSEITDGRPHLVRYIESQTPTDLVDSIPKVMPFIGDRQKAIQYATQAQQNIHTLITTSPHGSAAELDRQFTEKKLVTMDRLIGIADTIDDKWKPISPGVSHSYGDNYPVLSHYDQSGSVEIYFIQDPVAIVVSTEKNGKDGQKVKQAKIITPSELPDPRELFTLLYQQRLTNNVGEVLSGIKSINPTTLPPDLLWNLYNDNRLLEIKRIIETGTTTRYLAASMVHYTTNPEAAQSQIKWYAKEELKGLAFWMRARLRATQGNVNKALDDYSFSAPEVDFLTISDDNLAELDRFGKALSKLRYLTPEWIIFVQTHTDNFAKLSSLLDRTNSVSDPMSWDYFVSSIPETERAGLEKWKTSLTFYKDATLPQILDELTVNTVTDLKMALSSDVLAQGVAKDIRAYIKTHFRKLSFGRDDLMPYKLEPLILAIATQKALLKVKESVVESSGTQKAEARAHQIVEACKVDLENSSHLPLPSKEELDTAYHLLFADPDVQTVATNGLIVPTLSSALKELGLTQPGLAERTSSGDHLLRTPYELAIVKVIKVLIREKLFDPNEIPLILNFMYLNPKSDYSAAEVELAKRKIQFILTQFSS